MNIYNLTDNELAAFNMLSVDLYNTKQVFGIDNHYDTDIQDILEAIEQLHSVLDLITDVSS